MIRVWGRLSSINVRKVVLTLQLLGLLGLPFRTHRGRRQVRRGAHAEDLARNPSALVPLLDDGTLTASR